MVAWKWNITGQWKNMNLGENIKLKSKAKLIIEDFMTRAPKQTQLKYWPSPVREDNLQSTDSILRAQND